VGASGLEKRIKGETRGGKCWSRRGSNRRNFRGLLRGEEEIRDRQTTARYSSKGNSGTIGSGWGYRQKNLIEDGETINRGSKKG